jgi:hypothetical protein
MAKPTVNTKATKMAADLAPKDAVAAAVTGGTYVVYRLQDVHISNYQLS